MPQRCKVCDHPKLKIIEETLRAGVSLRSVAAIVEDITKDSLFRHRHHMAGTATESADRDHRPAREKPRQDYEIESQEITRQLSDLEEEQDAPTEVDVNKQQSKLLDPFPDPDLLANLEAVFSRIPRHESGEN